MGVRPSVKGLRSPEKKYETVIEYKAIIDNERIPMVKLCTNQHEVKNRLIRLTKGFSRAVGSTLLETVFGVVICALFARNSKPDAVFIGYLTRCPTSRYFLSCQMKYDIVQRIAQKLRAPGSSCILKTPQSISNFENSEQFLFRELCSTGGKCGVSRIRNERQLDINVKEC